MPIQAPPAAQGAGGIEAGAPAPPRVELDGHRPLRVAMVHLSDYRFDSRIQRQATALAERGDTVELICLGDRDEIRVGRGVIRIHPIPGAKPSGGVHGYAFGYARFLAAAARRLTVLELRTPLDLVEVHNMPDALTLAGIVPKLRGVPVILNLHDTFPELLASKFQRPHDGWEVRLLEVEERLSARLADALITVTDEARERILARGVGAGRTIVVMNSPDERTFGPAREPISVPSTREVRVLYHGGLAPRFGVKTLVEAVSMLADNDARVTLRVCGDGEDLPTLRGLAAEVGHGRVDIAGPVPFGSIPSELVRAHIGVVPTLHDRFTELLLPVKLLEYIHAGLPVIASRLPGINRYFSADELNMFEPGDPHALAAALTDVCRDPDAARRRARLASDRLRQLSWEHQRGGYLALVDGLVSQRRALARRSSTAPQVSRSIGR